MTKTQQVFTRAAGLLLVVGLILAVGCNPPPKKRQFNNRLARLNQDLANKGKVFYKTISQLKDGVNVSPGAARGALDECRKALKDVKEVFDATGTPVGSLSAVDMRAKYANFLKAEQTLLDDYFAKIVQIVESKQTPAEKWAAIEPLFDRAERVEKEAYDELIKAQQEYSQKHNYTPK